MRLRSIALAIGAEACLLVAIATIPSTASERERIQVTIRSEVADSSEPVEATPREPEREALPEAKPPEPQTPALPEREPEPVVFPLPSPDVVPETPIEDFDQARALVAHALDKLSKKPQPEGEKPTEPEVVEPPEIAPPAVTPPPVARPSTPELLAGWNDPPRYPKRAQKLRLEGVAEFEIIIDRNGLVQDVRLVTSSGHGLLDLAARRALLAWRFDRGPARFPWRIEFRLDGKVKSGTPESRDG